MEHDMKINAYKIVCILSICFLCGFIHTLAGCAAFNWSQPPVTSGFLKDYSNLRSGKGDEALMVYINRSVNVHVYDSVLIDQVSIIYSKNSYMEKLSAKDRQAIADYFYTALEDNLGKDYIIASKPGSLTMRVRFALTDIQNSEEVMDTVSSERSAKSGSGSFLPVLTGKYAFLSAATAEMELLDSMNGQRLAAAVDRRTGVWDSVKEGCDFWAQRLAQRLYEFSRGYNLLDKD
jgi:hypothetical protein